MKLAYNSFFESILLYGICLWGSSAGVKDILIIQKKAVRILAGAEQREHCKPLFIKCRVLTVYCIFVLYAVLNVKSKLDVLTVRSDVHQHDTRFKHQINVPFCRLSKVANYYETIGIKLFNRLPDRLRKVRTLPIFKSMLTNGLLRHPLYSLDEFFNLTVTEFDDFK